MRQAERIDMNKKKLILISVVTALVAVAAIIAVACSTSTTTTTATAVASSCVACHTDQAQLQELTVNFPLKPESALIKGEC